MKTLENGTLLLFHKKVGCISPFAEGWVVVKTAHPKGKPSFYLLSLKGSYQPIGCINVEEVEQAMEKEIVEIVGKINLKPSVEED